MKKRTLRRFCHIALSTVFVFSLIIFPDPNLMAQLLTLPVNVSYLSRRADIIVQGRVVDVRYENLPGYANIPTVEVSLEVENMLRGPEGHTYTFREVLIGLKAREGKNTYHVGERILVFLPSPSRYGLSSPIGIEQGRFHIARSPEGEEIVVNEIDNAGLFKNMDTASYMSAMQLSQNRMKNMQTAGRGPVRLDGFVALVKSLMTLPRIQ
ncbi:MAG: hypothetical protein P8Y80_13105 [Acidobacteriota bacterium]|jgi:hypothetical protein